MVRSRTIHVVHENVENDERNASQSSIASLEQRKTDCSMAILQARLRVLSPSAGSRRTSAFSTFSRESSPMRCLPLVESLEIVVVLEQFLIDQIHPSSY
jgi:hypothetical protein